MRCAKVSICVRAFGGLGPNALTRLRRLMLPLIPGCLELAAGLAIGRRVGWLQPAMGAALAAGVFIRQS
jgi:hypothetical protein